MGLGNVGMGTFFVEMGWVGTVVTCKGMGRGQEKWWWVGFALNLPRKDLRILTGLLTGHTDLNRHLQIMGLRQDSVCPLCQEEEDTTVHFIAPCSALVLRQKNVLGDYILSLDTLCNIHWFLLKIAKASKRFYWPCGLLGLRIGPMLWPQRWVPAHAVINPANKVRQGVGMGLISTTV